MFLRDSAKNRKFRNKSIAYYERIVDIQRKWKATFEKLRIYKESLLEMIKSGIMLLDKMCENNKKAKKNFPLHKYTSSLELRTKEKVVNDHV
jgi:hypothetical protein